MQEVLKKIKPNKEEQAKFKQSSDSFLEKIKIKDAQAILGGSGAKDTWLSGNHDVDIYVVFDYKKYAKKSPELSGILEKELKRCFPKIKIEQLHGSRDYFQLNYQNRLFEIIPILQINKAKEALNITDISPLHSVWINKHTKKLKDEIRLAKQFCKANNLYGAESYLAGFSGYVLEILIAHYGSFEKLLRASQLWKIKEIVDTEKHYQKKTALLNLNQSKLQSSLIVIDPVDKSRNASAALGTEKFSLFKKLAKSYLQQPNTNFFTKKEISFPELKKETENKKLNLVYLELQPLTGKRDVVGSKLLKAFQFLEQHLTAFEIKKSGWDWNKYYFFLGKRELPKVIIRPGPPLNLKQFVKDFQKKNKDNFIKDGRIYAKIKVQNPKLEDYLSQLLKDEYVQEKIKKITKLAIV